MLVVIELQDYWGKHRLLFLLEDIENTATWGAQWDMISESQLAIMKLGEQIEQDFMQCHICFFLTEKASSTLSCEWGLSSSLACFFFFWHPPPVQWQSHLYPPLTLAHGVSKMHAAQSWKCGKRWILPYMETVYEELLSPLLAHQHWMSQVSLLYLWLLHWVSIICTTSCNPRSSLCQNTESSLAKNSSSVIICMCHDYLFQLFKVLTGLC